MSSAWRSPWPQWRSHWHVLHAWPASAQGLVLSALSLCFTALLSVVYSNEAWLAWWQAEEEAQAWQQSIQGLQTQLAQHQAQVSALQQLAHPSGLNLPAWQMPTAQQTANGLHAVWQQLAQSHGLQAPPQLDDSSSVWVGPLPHLLAAWQQLPQELAQHAVASFELTPVPGSNALELSVTWLTWSDQAVARPLKVSLPQALVSEDAVLHNPFASEGLRQALPEAAHLAKAGELRGMPLSDMRWVGMFRQGDQAQALVAHAGLIRPVALGQTMGQDFGEVVHIAPDHLLLREWHANALGLWQQQTKRFPDQGQP